MRFLTTWLHRYSTLIGIIFLSLWLILLLSTIIAGMLSIGIYPYGVISDFRAFYLSGQMVLHGVTKDFYVYNMQFFWQRHIFGNIPFAKQLTAFLYPPVIALFFVPFALFPFTTGYLLWLFFNCIIFCFLWWGIVQLLPQKNKQKQLFIFLIIATYGPVLITLVQAQVSYLLTFSFLFCRLLLLKKKDFLAGIVLSFLIIKPQYVIIPLLFLLMRRYYKAFLGCICGLLCFTTISFSFVGLQGIQNYMHLLTSRAGGQTLAASRIGDPTIQGFLATLFETTHVHIELVWIIITIIVLLVALYMLVRKTTQENGFDLQYAIIIIMTVLVSLHTNFQDLSMLSIAGVLLIRMAHVTKIRKLKLLLYSLVTTGYLLGVFTSFVPELLHIKLYALFLLLVFFLLILITDNAFVEKFLSRVNKG